MFKRSNIENFEESVTTGGPEKPVTTGGPEKPVTTGRPKIIARQNNNNPETDTDTDNDNDNDNDIININEVLDKEKNEMDKNLDFVIDKTKSYYHKLKSIWLY